MNETDMAALFAHFEKLKEELKPLFEMHERGEKLPISIGEFEQKVMEMEYVITELQRYGLDNCWKAYFKSVAPERVAAKN